MKNIGISAVVALALSSSLAMADDALAESFKNGKTYGQIGVFGVTKELKEIEEDKKDKKSGFVNAFAEIGYESAPLYGVSVGLSAFGAQKIDSSVDDKGEGGYKGEFGQNSIFNRAFLKVAHEGMGSVVIGRQKAAGFEWLSKYIEAAVASIKPMDELEVKVAWASRRAKAQEDAIADFKLINGDDKGKSKGMYVLDVKYSLMDMVTLNPYYYHKTDKITAPGIKAMIDVKLGEGMASSTMLQYVMVKSESKNFMKDEDGNIVKVDDEAVKIKDGSVMHIEQGFEFSGASLGVGYIMAGKDSGANGLNGTGAKSNPFEEGDKIYKADAKTLYFSLGYEYEGISLGAVYGMTDYKDKKDEETVKIKEKELNVSAGYEILKNLEAGVVYTDIKNDAKSESWSSIKGTVAYSF
ncbi:MAG: Opr family porin [Wolinella sp.]